MQKQLEGRSHLINLPDKNDSRNTILHLACEHHHLTLVTWLLQQQSQLMVNLSNQEGKSAFFVACEQGFSDIVKAMLLSRSTTQPLLNVNVASKKHSPLMIACKGGHVGVVKELLGSGGDKVEVNRVFSGSALTNACDSGNMEILELLLNHPNIDVNQKIQQGSTVLHHVCYKNRLAQLKRLLQLPTLNVNHQTDTGLTPLMVACQCGRPSIVHELMKYKKVDPNICDPQNRTALWLAAKKGKVPSFLFILCTPHWVIDTVTKPKDEEYPRQFAEYLVEYARDSDKFRVKYGGGTQSYEHPHPGK